MLYISVSGLVHSGVGRNLDEASAPKYLETKNGRGALISVNTTFHPPMMAGKQSPRVAGRPGINGLRIEEYIELPKEELEQIRRIARLTNINAAKEIIRKEGYFPELAPDEGDMARVEKTIYEAQLQADYIMVSVHSHQISGDAKENPAEFLKDFAHRCIDMGAHAIVGHGPHLLRPIEVYKDCPIFYSLGDFVLQLYSIEFAPEEFYANHGLTSDSTVYELLKKRSQNFRVGLMEDPRMFCAVIPYWETDGTKLIKLQLMPVEMSMKGNKSEQGLPRRSYNPEIFEYLANMCKPYGTKLPLNDDGIIECSW